MKITYKEYQVSCVHTSHPYNMLKNLIKTNIYHNKKHTKRINFAT